MLNQKGQVILILILVMTVALAIGLSVIQRSLSDISTASKVEQSSRAFSAAEAGIEKSIQSGSSLTTPISLDNNATIQEVQASPIPLAGQALEYPPIAREEMAHVWLANPDTLAKYYDQSSIDVYWGDPDTTDNPAIEATIVYKDSSNEYRYKKFFYDSDQARTSSNRFTYCTKNASGIDTSMGTNRTFLCRATLTGLSPTLILLRARVLYSSVSQPFAVLPNSPTGSCNQNSCSLPIQAKIFTATGVSGTTQRKIQVFRLDKVVPPYFDYAIFSAGDISK